METDEQPPKSIGRDEAPGSVWGILDGILRVLGWIFLVFLAAPFVGCFVSLRALGILANKISGPIGFNVTLILIFAARVIAFVFRRSGR